MSPRTRATGTGRSTGVSPERPVDGATLVPGRTASANEDAAAAGSTRSQRKRVAILAAATGLFLQQGYAGTSMDEIAARAVVSKQTVYKHFADKEQLFGTIILSTTAQAAAFAEAVPALLSGRDDLEQALRALARRYIRVVLEPQVLQLRRLIIAEARHFPELARTYYERAPERVVAALASAFQRYAGRGLLALDDPVLAASHFAFLILAIPLDRAMFYGEASRGAPDEGALDRLADAGVRVFLAAYGDQGARAGSPVDNATVGER